MIDVSSGRAEVFINGENLGVTPYESQDIKPGSNKVTLKSTNRQYETNINFLSTSDKYIHKVGVFRDLGISDLFSSGQDVWFDEDTTDTVLRVISEPSGATVYIDTTEIGKTPFTSSKLTEGDYDIRIEKVGYEGQKTRVHVQKGYTSNLSVKLFPMPVPARVSPFAGSTSLYDISLDNTQVVTDTQTWAKGVVYWNQTRGINLESVGINKELVFDYLIDYKGTIYDNLGNLVLDDTELQKIKKDGRGAYMGRVSDGLGLSEGAKEALAKINGSKVETAGAVTEENMVEILDTGLGWLRVRNEPTTSGTEVGKVDVGKKYAVIEEQAEWVKIKASDTLEGWVSSRYTKKVTPTTAPVTDGTVDTAATDGTGATTNQ